MLTVVACVCMLTIQTAGTAMADQEASAEVLLWLRAMAGVTIGQDDSGTRAKPQRDVHPTAPFGFRYGDRSSAEFLKRCDTRCDAKPMDKNRTSHTVRYHDPETKLELRWEGIAYRDFPTVEWTLYFKNTGAENTPILSDIQPLKTTFKTGTGAEAVLHGNLGDTCSPSSFQPITKNIPPNATYTTAARGGRPTNGAFPYFNLESGGQGLIAVIAWPGQWKATFHRDGGNRIHVAAGQERTHFTLHPGEEVRTPRIVLQFWKGGDWIDAQNVWRRWMIAYNMPRPGGKRVPPMNLGSSYRVHAEMTRATEQNLIPFIGRFVEEKLPIDCWWMDAGWYECGGGWTRTGNWWPDPVRFPKGLRPVCDFAHKNGMKTMVWFEPERVQPGTWLSTQHPEWLLPATSDVGGPFRRGSKDLGGVDPNVTYNATTRTLAMGGIRWNPGRLAFHPGPKGEYSVVRWTARGDGPCVVKAAFLAIDPPATTDVHVLHNGRSLFKGRINLGKQGKRVAFEKEVAIAKSDTLDFVVGFGNGNHTCDSTGLEVTLRDASGRAHDAAGDFKIENNPNGAWSYGYLRPGPAPDGSTFRLYDVHDVLNRKGQGRKLLDLGNPAARQWLTDHVDRLMREQGIDFYRQDFNMDPLALWRGNDAEDRQGITEIKHVTGYLAHLAELKRRHPDALIDTCASGGRRLSLDTLRYAVPLWRSDYQYVSDNMPGLTYGLALWIPYFGGGNLACQSGYYGQGALPVQPYAFWACCYPAINCAIDVRAKNADYQALRELFRKREQVMPYYYGDFYPLTSHSLSPGAWLAWQFHRPETGEGLVQAFRRTACKTASRQYPLRGLDGEAEYEVTTIEGTSGTTRLTGKALAEKGLTVLIEDQPGAAVFTYRSIR